MQLITKFGKINKLSSVYISQPFGYKNQNFFYNTAIEFKTYINHKNARLVINNTKPNGLDISRSLKNDNNDICEKKLNKLIQSLSVD